MSARTNTGLDCGLECPPLAPARGVCLADGYKDPLNARWKLDIGVEEASRALNDEEPHQSQSLSALERPQEEHVLHRA